MHTQFPDLAAHNIQKGLYGYITGSPSTFNSEILSN
jgi:hypothetical protein